MDTNNSMVESTKKKIFTREFAPHQANEPIIRFDKVSYRYDGVLALDDVSFELESGIRLAVVGPNGAGKSTLFKVMSGILLPTSGDIKIYGHEPRGHVCIAYVPQRIHVDWNFPVNVADVVMMGRIRRIGLLRWPKKEDWLAVNQALQVVQLVELADRQINELSGGQQQRMFIARALAQEAEIILMDEPLSGLDFNSQQDIFRIIEKLHHQGVTVMVALHDLKLAAEQFDRVMLLNRKLIGLDIPEIVFEPQNLMDVYGSHLRMIPTVNGTVALEDTCCDESDHEHG